MGRTGTYIAVDTQLEKAKSEGIIDVYNFVRLMRTQRVNMVQTLVRFVLSVHFFTRWWSKYTFFSNNNLLLIANLKINSFTCILWYKKWVHISYMLMFQEQYIFVYDCLLEALICGDTTVSSHAFPEVYTDLCLFDTDISKTKLEEQFEVGILRVGLQSTCTDCRRCYLDIPHQFICFHYFCLILMLKY